MVEGFSDFGVVVFGRVVVSAFPVVEPGATSGFAVVVVTSPLDGEVVGGATEDATGAFSVFVVSLVTGFRAAVVLGGVFGLGEGAFDVVAAAAASPSSFSSPSTSP